MDKTKTPEPPRTLSVHAAARLLAADEPAVRTAELRLSHAIERGELAASIRRWATEQWEGERLEGNIDRRRTFIARADFDRWCERCGLSGASSAS